MKSSRSVWLMISLLAVLVTAGTGVLVYAGMRTNRILVVPLPRSAWGFGAQRFYLWFVGDRSRREEAWVCRLGAVSVILKTGTLRLFRPEARAARVK
jgi:hypothetical protein